jgi:hypothetical protein
MWDVREDVTSSGTVGMLLVGKCCETRRTRRRMYEDVHSGNTMINVWLLKKTTSNL